MFGGCFCLLAAIGGAIKRSSCARRRERTLMSITIVFKNAFSISLSSAEGLFYNDADFYDGSLKPFVSDRYKLMTLFCLARLNNERMTALMMT